MLLFQRQRWQRLPPDIQRRALRKLQSIAMMPSRNPDHPTRLFHYILPGGWRVLAGRTDADNDCLSLHIAKPNDWWFHVRGMPGSHVLLLARPGDTPDRTTLKRAAAIAAYHSKARTGGVVAVSCTRARYVTKPGDAPPGTVQIRKEVVMKVRPEAPEPAPGEDSSATISTIHAHLCTAPPASQPARGSREREHGYRETK
jgi:predicted ribosome quality control (RQC) complex YloA/Tae2 family protein